MPRRKFTVADVDRLIPELERILADVVQLHGAFRRAEERLESLGVNPTKAMLSGDDTGGSPAVRQAKAKFRGFYEVLLESLGEVADLGGEVKDLDLGLVDFPGRRGSEDILLCWRMGEKSVTHWHPVDTGFSDRQPIELLGEGSGPILASQD